MIRHLVAAHIPSAARAIGVPRRLSQLDGVALTFDDGPHPDGTPAMLDALARAGACATFFMVGEQVQRRPALVREVLAAGHAVALHGYRHHLQARLGAATVREDVARGLDVVSSAAGTPLRWHRPPYGVYSPAGLRAVRDAGLQPLLWSRWGKDWRRLTTPERIARRAGRDPAPGEVILLHDADFYSSRGSHERTAAALGLLLTNLNARGIGTVLLV